MKTRITKTSSCYNQLGALIIAWQSRWICTFGGDSLSTAFQKLQNNIQMATQYHVENAARPYAILHIPYHIDRHWSRIVLYWNYHNTVLHLQSLIFVFHSYLPNTNPMLPNYFISLSTIDIDFPASQFWQVGQIVPPQTRKQCISETDVCERNLS